MKLIYLMLAAAIAVLGIAQADNTVLNNPNSIYISKFDTNHQYVQIHNLYEDADYSNWHIEIDTGDISYNHTISEDSGHWFDYGETLTVFFGSPTDDEINITSPRYNPIYVAHNLSLPSSGVLYIWNTDPKNIPDKDFNDNNDYEQYLIGCISYNEV